MAARQARGKASGFTLLEVMVALAILGATTVALISIVTNNVRATNHAKLTTAATFLARAKMVDLEDDVLTNGFIDNDDRANGTFKDQGYPAFRWESAIERVELPTDMAQKTKDMATDKMNGSDSSSSSSNPMSMLTGFLGGMMSSFIEPIRIGLQESVRRVTVRVFWDETGRPNQSFEVVQYLTDPAKLDLALAAGNAAAGAMPGAPGMPGAAGTGAGAIPGLPAGIGGLTGAKR